MGLCELMRDEMETYKSTKFEMRQVEFIQGYNPREAIETIDYLNCINNKQLEELQLTRTQVIKIEKLIILNQNLYRVLQYNTNIFIEDICSLKIMFSEAIRLGIPSLRD